MSALDDARESVQRSDMAQSDTLPLATQAETRALRDALRALIQHVEDLERRSAATA